MSALGELEPVDYAIHSDTTHEREDTYKFADKWRPWLLEMGVEVITVKPKTTRQINPHGGIFIPGYTTDGTSKGQLRRQCTGEWKIAPLRRKIQELRNGMQVEQWLGITLDEVQRMKESNVRYITHRWPLIEKRMTRWDCVRWLQDHDLDVPPRSACVFCPFHSRSEWRDIKQNSNEDWNKAVLVDSQIRKARPPHDLYVCDQRLPLKKCDFDSLQDKGQLDLWENECDGMCGV